MTTRFVSMAYMKDFQCIGSDCEATCCQGWQVPVRNEDYPALKGACNKYPQLAKNLEEVLIAPDGNWSDHRLKTDNSGRCTFLETTGLCRVQALAGKKALPSICATYPRSISRIGVRTEISAHPSCPEIARKLLLEPNSVNRLAASAKDVVRPVAHQHIPNPLAHPYTKHIDELRDIAFHYLEMPLPLSHRLYLLAEVAKLAAPVLTPDRTTDAEAELEKVLAPMLEEKNLIASSQHLTRLNWNAEEGFSILLQLLQIRSESSVGSKSHKVTQLVEELEQANNIDLTDVETAAKVLFPLHQQRSARLHELAGERLEQYGTRFAINYWFSNLYTSSPSLLAHTRRLLLVHGIQRLMLVNHPTIIKSLESGNYFFQTEMDRLAVQIVYNVSRALEHSKILGTLDEALDNPHTFPLLQKLAFI
jgi:lysine-N-methylase